jgi:UDP-3-O-[3-hydroxymyristoyl] glucosamine N-acyltransferase
MTLSELCRRLREAGLPAELNGEDRTVRAVNTLEQAGPDEISFLSNVKYVSLLKSTRAGAVVVKDGVEVPDSLVTLRCKDPYAAITVAIVELHGYRRHPRWGRNPNADIHPTAIVGEDVHIAGGVTIAAGAVVGDRCTLYPGCYVGDRARIGRDCVLFPNVVIYDDCVLGDRVTIHAGSVIGEDGLGYAPRDGHWVKIPQVGRAVIGDDVEIGANCTIDRATLGETEIGAGTKMGNVVVIGHGTRVGADCMFVGLVGIAGSVVVGRHVTLAGQVGVAGHLQIGDNVTVGAQAGIVGNVEASQTLLGSPAVPVDEAKRSFIWIQRLPELARRVRELEQHVEELRGRGGGEGKG